MNTNTVCIFPDTVPTDEVLFPLVQAFGPIVYLRPVENDDPAADSLPPLCRELVESGHVRFSCPAPLAEDRERFLQLVDDLQNRGGDYAGQLSNLALAGLGSSRKTETKTSIISTLLKQTGISDAEEQQLEMLLWQARLILKLAEKFDRDQVELQKNLEQIAARENGLITELREENEQPFSLTRSLAAADGRTDGQLRLRLKAWSRLFGLGSRPITATTFITTNQDSFDLLTEQYELEQNRAPRLIVKLELPGIPGDSSSVQQSAAFNDDAAELINSLKSILADPAAAGKQEAAAPGGADSRWTELLEKHYPTAENSRCTLSLYALPGINPAALFLETFGRDEDEILHERKDSELTGAVIGIVREETYVEPTTI